MIDSLLAPFAPHLCFGCGKIGSILCDYCKYDITQQPYDHCLECGDNIFDNRAHPACQLPYDKTWCVSERSGALERVIDAYKFERARAGFRPLAALLDDTLPELPPDTVIVPVPTIPRHIRQRGYDHMELICRQLARRRRLSYKRLLTRQHGSVQRGASRRQRIEQAERAFGCKTRVSADIPYLLIDDVVTTGSTLRYGATELKRAGARTIWVAAIAKQPLD